MLPLSSNTNYLVFNLSSKWAAYRYMYYASLSTGESYALLCTLSILSVLGLFLTVLVLFIHFCAICFARKHLYQRAHRQGRARGNAIQLRNKSHPDVDNKLGGWALLSRKSCCQRTTPDALHDHVPNMSKTATSPPPSLGLPLTNETTLVEMTYYPKDKKFPCLRESVNYPGVSIIKPLAGVDKNIVNNLRSYFRLDYPVYELLFCVAEQSDPICELVRSLQADYPHIQSRLITAEQKVGVNPKINNLQAGYNAAYYDLLLISDAGIWMRPDTLSDMVWTMQMDEKNGLIHQVPFLKPYFGAFDSPQSSQSESLEEILSTRPPFAWIVQLVFFGCWHAKIYLSAALLGINCTTGMSCLLRKAVILPIGGFAKFGCYLAEDFFLSKFCLSHGWKVRVSHQPAWQNSFSGSLPQFHSRLNRWSQLRLSMVPLAYCLEPLTRLLPNAIVSSLSMAYLFPNMIDPGVYTLCLSLLWFLLDYLMLCCVYPPNLPLSVNKVEFLAAWLYTELTMVPAHFTVFFKKQLSWRNQRFRVRWGGLTEALPTESLCAMKEQAKLDQMSV